MVYRAPDGGASLTGEGVLLITRRRLLTLVLAGYFSVYCEEPLTLYNYLNKQGNSLVREQDFSAHQQTSLL